MLLVSARQSWTGKEKDTCRQPRVRDRPVRGYTRYYGVIGSICHSSRQSVTSPTTNAPSGPALRVSPRLTAPHRPCPPPPDHVSPPVDDYTIASCFATTKKLVWFRSSSGGGFAEIKGVDGPYYQPSADDIGTRICIKCTLTGGALASGGGRSPVRGIRGRSPQRGGGGGGTQATSSPHRHQSPHVAFAEVEHAWEFPKWHMIILSVVSLACLRSSWCLLSVSFLWSGTYCVFFSSNESNNSLFIVAVFTWVLFLSRYTAPRLVNTGTTHCRLRFFVRSCDCFTVCFGHTQRCLL